MTAVCAYAHGLLSAEALRSPSTEIVVIGTLAAGTVIAFFVLAYRLIRDEKAFASLKIGRSGFEVRFTPFTKDDPAGDDEDGS
jgi:hypothetical protein